MVRGRRGRVRSWFDMGGGGLFVRRFVGRRESVSSTMEVCMAWSWCLRGAVGGRVEVMECSFSEYLEVRVCFVGLGLVEFDKEL